MASSSKTVNVTVLETPYGVPGPQGVSGPTGPAGPPGPGFKQLNFSGNLTVSYGNISTITVDTDASLTAFEIGVTLKVNLTVLGTYIFGQITNYVGTSLSFLQISGTALNNTSVSSGTIIYAAPPADGGVASQSSISEITSTATPYYVPVVGGTGNQSFFVDTDDKTLKYIPSTGTLRVSQLEVGTAGNYNLLFKNNSIGSTGSFYFTSTDGIFLQDKAIVQLGDVSSAIRGTILEVDGATNDNYIRIRNQNESDTNLLINRNSSAARTHALEINKSDGKGVKLIYNDVTSNGSTNVLLDVNSSGNFVVTPSGNQTNITGNFLVGGSYYGNILTGLNGLTGSLTIAAGSNVGITISGNILTLSASGSTGLQGNTGPTGPAGPQGNTGNNGSQGPAGPQGNTGPTGPQGNTGNNGSAGTPGDVYRTTSTTGITLSSISPGSGITLTVGSGLAYSGVQPIIVAANINNYFNATVSSYSGVSLGVSVTGVCGSGYYNSWDVNLAGAAGVPGAAGATGPTGPMPTNYVASFNGFTGSIQGVSSWNGFTGAVVFSNYVSSFNGRTGSIEGVSAAFGGTGIALSGSTGSVTIRNTGVLSFNGNTGIIEGVTRVNGATGEITNIATTSSNQDYTGAPTFKNAFTVYSGSPAPLLNGGLTSYWNFNVINAPTLQYYNEPCQTTYIASGNVTFDLSTAQVFVLPLTSTVTTVNIVNTPTISNRAIGFTLIVKINTPTATINWGSSIKWANGTSPTLSNTTKSDIFSFISVDNGTSWLGFIGGQNFDYT